MSTETFELADDTPQNLRDYIARLEEQAKGAGTAAEVSSKLEREVAFLKAGVDPEDPKAKWFAKGYDGDLTPDAVKAAAIEAGVIEANPAPPEQRTAEQIAAGEGAGGDGNLPDYRQSKEAFQSEMKRVHAEGGTPALLELLEKNGVGNTRIQ